MRSGMLFRSDELSRLSGRDLEKLQQFNVKLICDLRTPNERRSKPARIPKGDSIQIVNIPFYHQYQDFTRLSFFWFLIGKSRKMDFETFTKEYYAHLAFGSTTQIRETIALISEKRNLPALIHCTAGKDRTGFISALIQLLLGVPRETVLQDYLVTNHFFEPRRKKYMQYMRWMSVFQISPERIQPLLEARREYLEDILDKILGAFGSVEAYLKEGCDIPASRIRDLKQLLTETSPGEERMESYNI